MEDLDINELSALLAEQTQRLGPDHVDVLSTRHLLARRFAERSGYAQAVPLFEQLVIDRTRVIGERHRDTLASHHNLALCLARCGQVKKSKAIFEEVIRMLEETYGSDDDDTVRTHQWYLNDVVSELESHETIIKEYELLLAKISSASKKRVSRNREIRRQYEDFLEKIGARTNVASPTTSSEERFIELVLEQKRKSKAGPSKEEKRESKSFKYEPELRAWHSKLAFHELDGELHDWRKAIFFDAQDISLTIVGHIEDVLAEYLKESFQCDQDEQKTLSQFEVLKKLVEKGTGSALRLAGQIAVAYIDFAFFSAHVSGIDLEASQPKIDQLRLQLRELLGTNVDTTSDAEFEFEKSFQEIIGLDSVKRELMGFIRVLTENKRQLARGSKSEPPRLHLVFAGSPGTGKTTVARIYGRLLFQLGLLESDKFTEIDKSKLVSTYTGGTELETKKFLEEANSGVIFIDEAYSFNDNYGDNSKGPGQRALEIIIKYMEDYRASLAIIFAGYSKEMSEFVKLNPGIPSRIGATINFPNYSLEELMEIARRAALKRGLKFEDLAQQKLQRVVEPLISKEDFGNAREIESLVEESQRNLLNRLAPLDDLATTNERCLILESDIPLREKPIARRYGFN